MQSNSESSLIQKIAYFFPIQLLLCHFKKNITIVIFWAALLGLVTGNIAVKYGIPFLFLDPEYIDKVSFWSFFIVGFSLGGFIMAFNISSYIRNSFRFPFLATLSSPFLKYCVNNSIIPVVFVLVYIYNIVVFQTSSEFNKVIDIIIDISGLISGIVLFILTTVIYVIKTNKDIFKMYNLKNPEQEEQNITKTEYSSRIQKVFMKENLSWKKLNPSKEDRDWHVETYLTSTFKLKLARGFEHYDKMMLKAVFKQNHKAAALFELITLLTLFILGRFREYSLFMIPAGASIFLLMTMLLMLTSALYTWIRGWTNVVILILFLFFNYIFRFEQFNFVNKAFGIDYKTRIEYSNEKLHKFENEYTTLIRDKSDGVKYLNNWKNKNSEKSTKPKLIIINCSGGGSRSAMWVVHALQYADSILKGDILNQTALITGASGGLVGATYLRELYLLKQEEKIKSFYDPVYSKNISKDMLNPITTTIATNDLFFRLQKHKVGSKTYTKDRGFSFENKLNQNTEYLFANKKLFDYKEVEQKAKIPLLIMSPTILNDGRRLLISAQNISYLTSKNAAGRIDMEFLNEAVEFRRLFKEQDADSLLITSALRMSATFPYISPIVSLPSEPRMDVMDAGIRDNFGINTAVQFLYTFKDWIALNTNGVVILQLRDRDKNFDIDENPLNTIVQTFSSPVGSFYSNLFHMQDYNNDQLIKYCNNWFAGPIDVVNLELHNLPTDRISLSWHLTTKEKNKVFNSIYNQNNQKAIQKLKLLLNK